MKAAVVISQISEPELRAKDQAISQLQRDLVELKSQFFKVVSQLVLT
jgi:hypothetical protein